MNYMPTGSYIEGHSLLHKMDAFLKLLCTFLMLAAIILSDTYTGYVVIITLIALCIKLSAIGFKNALNGVRHLWLFFIIIFLMNAFFFESEQALWSWWIFHFSMDGVAQGFNVILRVVLAMVLSNIFVSTTSTLEITGAMESLIYPLKYIGVPIQDVAMTLGVSIQFIPTFLEEAEMIRKAQTARGARFESRKFREKAASFLPLIVPVFLSAFRRADELSLAMEARGYHRTKRNIRAGKRKLHIHDVVALLFCSLVCVIEIII